MTSDEMVASFLKKNSVTECPDEQRTVDGEIQTRKSKQSAPSNIIGFRERRRDANSKPCELCGKQVVFYPDFSVESPLFGLVDGVYKADTWCRYCRSSRNKHGTSYLSARERTLITKYGSVNSAIKYKNLDKSMNRDEILNANEDELVVLVKQLEFLMSTFHTGVNQKLMLLAKKRLLGFVADREDLEWDD